MVLILQIVCSQLILYYAYLMTIILVHYYCHYFHGFLELIFLRFFNYFFFFNFLEYIATIYYN